MIAFVAVIVFGFVFELLFEFVFGTILESILGAMAEGAERAMRSRTVLAGLFWVSAVLVGAVAGAWRGAALGRITWGLWLATAAAVVSVLAALLRSDDSASDEPSRLRRLVFVWPRRRLIWFALANAAYATAFVSTAT